MRTWFRLTLCIALAMAVSSVVLPADAMARNISRVRSHRHYKASTRKATTQPSPSTQRGNDQAALAAAEAQLKKAQTELGNVSRSLQSAFEQSTAWVNAQDALKSATAEYSAAREPVLANLHNNPDYVAALEARKTASEQLEASHAATDPSPETIASFAAAMLDASSKLTRIENQALQGDVPVGQAKARVDAAQAQLDELHAQFKSTSAQSPDWLQARKAVEAAQAKVDAARAKIQR